MLARRIALAALALAAGALVLSSLALAATKPKPKPNPKAVVLAYTVTNGKVVRGDRRPSVKRGKLVRIVVTVNKGEELHLHGYDLERVLRPGKAAVMQFTARLTGRFELELHDPDIVVARLSVTP